MIGSGLQTPCDIAFKLLANMSIPSGTSLLLDNSSMFRFDKKSNAYGLYITVGSSDTLDVLINT